MAVPHGQPTLEGHPLNSPSVDLLAGDLTDAQLQQLLEQVTPPNSPTPVITTAVPAAWAALQAKLASLGWARLHQQAAVSRQADPQQLTPAVVEVTLLWSGTATDGLRVDRRRAVVRLIATGQRWRSQRIS